MFSWTFLPWCQTWLRQSEDVFVTATGCVMKEEELKCFCFFPPQTTWEMTSSGLVVFCLLLLGTEVQGFGILPGNSLNHLEITEQAILNVTVQTCRALAQSEGTNFIFPVWILLQSNYLFLQDLKCASFCAFNKNLTCRHSRSLQTLLLQLAIRRSLLRPSAEPLFSYSWGIYGSTSATLLMQVFTLTMKCLSKEGESSQREQ